MFEGEQCDLAQALEDGARSITEVSLMTAQRLLLAVDKEADRLTDRQGRRKAFMWMDTSAVGADDNGPSSIRPDTGTRWFNRREILAE
ncbi:hypothetical protein RRG08_026352 [Elysia crispata]|uniref:Uncharacterized protein n=1 Tax=Elysia crispata TaxID=231223 RepID=A0AAE0XP55_9GAST|nr:hypothetical protein RRG08_026352 [Elysia crispata]